MSKNVAYDEYIDKVLSEPKGPFTPFASYDTHGDCIEFFLKPDGYYAERLDGLLTVYRSQENKDIVGALIKGVSSLCKEILGKFPGFRVEVHDGKLPLVHIFRVKLWSLRDEKEEIVHIYKILTDAAEESKTEVENPLLATAIQAP